MFAWAKVLAATSQDAHVRQAWFRKVAEYRVRAYAYASRSQQHLRAASQLEQRDRIQRAIVVTDAGNALAHIPEPVLAISLRDRSADQRLALEARAVKGSRQSRYVPFTVPGFCQGDTLRALAAAGGRFG